MTQATNVYYLGSLNYFSGCSVTYRDYEKKIQRLPQVSRVVVTLCVYGGFWSGSREIHIGNLGHLWPVIRGLDVYTCNACFIIKFLYMFLHTFFPNCLT